jgi:hypothetical protein
MLSAIDTKWEGDIGLYVAIPLIVQPVNALNSEVGMQQKRREK